MKNHLTNISRNRSRLALRQLRCSATSLIAPVLVAIPLSACVNFGMGQIFQPSSTNNSPSQEHSVWEASPGILLNYSSAYVTQIDVLSGDTGRLVPATDSEIGDISTQFRSEVIRALGDKYAVIPVQARGVAIIKVKLLNICSTRALAALRPGLLIPNNLRGGGTMEATFYDSGTGQEIGRIVDSRVGQRQGFASGFGKWDGLNTAFGPWSSMIAKSLG